MSGSIIPTEASVIHWNPIHWIPVLVVDPGDGREHRVECCCLTRLGETSTSPNPATYVRLNQWHKLKLMPEVTYRYLFAHCRTLSRGLPAYSSIQGSPAQTFPLVHLHNPRDKGKIQTRGWTTRALWTTHSPRSHEGTHDVFHAEHDYCHAWKM
jgi:hypothetical protein